MDDATLKTYEIEEMVPWILRRGNDLGHTSIRTTRSLAAGLSHRRANDTVRDTLAWFRELTAERRASAKWVISREKEREILAAARAR